MHLSDCDAIFNKEVHLVEPTALWKGPQAHGALWEGPRGLVHPSARFYNAASGATNASSALQS